MPLPGNFRLNLRDRDGLSGRPVAQRNLVGNLPPVEHFLDLLAELLVAEAPRFLLGFDFLARTLRLRDKAPKSASGRRSPPRKLRKSPIHRLPLRDLRHTRSRAIAAPLPV